MILPKSDVFSFDIETAIEGQIVDYPTMLSCSNGDYTFVAVGNDDIYSLAVALRESKATLVGHNSWQFDIPVMKKWGIEFDLGMDTMVMAYFLDETQSLGLESCVVKYLGYSGWKKNNNDWKTFDPNSTQAAEYAARDALYTLQLYRRFVELLGSRIQTIEGIIVPARKALTKMSERGIWINANSVSRVREQAEGIRDSTLRELARETNEWAKGTIFNPGSPKQVAAFLQFQGVQLPVTEAGNPSVSVEVLKDLKTPFTENLLQYRGALKTLNTYCEPYEVICRSEDGRVHPEYTMVRTLTGRSSARNLNVQNLTREYKDFFSAPKGKCIIESDFSAIEFRLAGWLAQEPTILENYRENPNWDPHRYFASKFFFKPESEVTKEERYIAKTGNFGLIYLGNGWTLWKAAHKEGSDTTLEEFEQLYRDWHEVFSGFKKWYVEIKHELVTTGMSKCVTGHERHFGDFKLLPFYMKKEALNQAVNVKVQNLAAHIAYIAMAELDRRGYPLIGFIHDSLLFEFESEQMYLDSKEEIEWVMTKWPREFLARKFDIDMDMPLCVEDKVKANHGS